MFYFINLLDTVIAGIIYFWQKSLIVKEYTRNLKQFIVEKGEKFFQKRFVKLYAKWSNYYFKKWYILIM